MLNLIIFLQSFSDSASIQISPHQNNFKTPHIHIEHHIEHTDPPKRALVATVRASHARGRCRQTQVRQMLADPHICLAHLHSAPSRAAVTFPQSDIDDTDDTDDNEHG